MVGVDGQPAKELRNAGAARAELDILGAHVEAQRRHYAHALEAVSLEAAGVLPADELQRLHDLHAELERALRASLQQQEAGRPSRHARAAEAVAAHERRAATDSQGGLADRRGAVDSAVCTLQ